MSLLDNRIKVATHAENTVLVEQGATDKSQLMLILTGSVKLVQRVQNDDDEDGDNEIVTSIVLADELIGGLQLLTGEPAFHTIKTRQACRVAYISSQDFYE